MKIDVSDRNEYIFNALATAISILVLYAVGCYIYRTFAYLDLIDTNKLTSTFILPTSCFMPENTERNTYIFLALLCPPLLLMMHVGMRTISLRFNLIMSATLRNVASLVIAGSLILLVMVDLTRSPNFFLNGYNSGHLLGNTLLFLAALTGIFMYFHVFSMRLKELSAGIVTAGFYIIFSVMMVTIGITPLLNSSSIEYREAYTIDFNAICYSFSQVFAGKALLVDLLNQYGFYPHFLVPLFKVIGFGMLKFTLVQSSLIVITFLIYFYFLRCMIRNKIILYAGFTMFLFYSYFLLKLKDGAEFYFANYPLRSIFPALLLLLSVWYYAGRSRGLYIASFFLFSIGVLWNFETGAVALIVWVLFLAYIEYARYDVLKSVKRSFIHASMGIGALVVTVAAFSLFIYFRNGSFPDFSKYFDYQRCFYMYGFFMLPMHLFHAWNLVILTYILGLSFAIRRLVQKHADRESALIFMLSVLGISLFSYYQGRSHDFNLTVVWYPALLIVVIFIDRLFDDVYLQAQHMRVDWGKVIVGLTVFYFIFSAVINTVSSVNYMYEEIKHKVAVLTHNGETVVKRNVNFVKNNTKPGEQILLISYLSGIYHLYSKTACPLKIPGLTELFLWKDFSSIYDFLSSDTNSRVMYDIDSNRANSVYNILSYPLWLKYKKVAKSIDGNLYLLEKGSDTINGRLDYQIYDSVKSIFHIKKQQNGSMTYCKNDGTLNFDGVCYKPVMLEDHFTIEAIIFPSGTQVPFATIISNRSGFSGFSIEHDSMKANVYSFSYGYGSAWLPGVRFSLTANIKNYLAVTFDHGTINVFNNGILVDTVNNTGDLKNTLAPLFLGNGDRGDRPFNGMIDEVAISNVLKNTVEIQRTWEKIRSQHTMGDR